MATEEKRSVTQECLIDDLRDKVQGYKKKMKKQELLGAAITNIQIIEIEEIIEFIEGIEIC